MPIHPHLQVQRLAADHPLAVHQPRRLLPKNGKTTKHHEALPYAQVPDALYKVRKSDAHLAVKLAFELLVLTAARFGEVAQATWAEFDLEAGLWTVPAEHMKASRNTSCLCLRGRQWC